MFKRLLILTTLIPTLAFGVDKVKPLKLNSAARTAEVVSTDYLGVKGLAFDNSDSTLIDVSGGDIQINTDFQMLGNSIFGNTSSSGHLLLNANTASLSDLNTGRIKIGERLVFDTNFTVTGSGGIGEFNFIDISPTISTALAINLIQGYRFAPTIRYSTAQVLSSTPGIRAQPVFQPTSEAADSANFFLGFLGAPTYSPDNAGTNSTGLIAAYDALPTVNRTNGSATVSALTVGGYATFASQFFANVLQDSTITNLIHFGANNPNTSSVTLTNNIVFNAPDLNLGTNRITLNSAQSSGSGSYFLKGNGTAVSFMQGGLRIGDSTAVQPTQKLEVMGNVLIDNTDNAAKELRFREPSTSGSNYSAFKAQAQSGDVTYTLPAADGSANQVLTTNGSGTLSWATPSAGGRVQKTRTTTQSVTNSTAFTDDNTLTSFSTSTGTYELRGMLNFQSTNTSSDCKIAITQAGSSTITSMAVSMMAMKVPTTAVGHISSMLCTASGTTCGAFSMSVANTDYPVQVQGSIVISGSGSIKLQFAQNSASPGNSCTIQSGSTLILTPQ